MNSNRQEGKAVIDEALEWIERCRADEGQSEAFFDWLTESPRHVEVFTQAMTLQQRIGAIAPDAWAGMDVNPAIGQDFESTNVIPIHDTLGLCTAPKSRVRADKTWIAATAAGVTVLAITLWLLLPLFSGAREFATAVGEQRTVQLEDGSIVNLNTGTRLQVSVTAKARDIRLLTGEALFKIQRDSARPFRVFAGDAVIQAIGTQFNVYNRAAGTTVSVLEGRVQISSATKKIDMARGSADPMASATRPAALSAGEQADMTPDGQVQRRSKLNPSRATAWQQRRLIFDEEPLESIAYEFNRYNRRQFHVQGTLAAHRRFSGVFDADDPGSLAQLLSRDERLAVKMTDSQFVVTDR